MLQGSSLFGEGFRTPESTARPSASRVADELPAVSILDNAAPLDGTHQQQQQQQQQQHMASMMTPTMGAFGGPSNISGVSLGNLSFGNVTSAGYDDAGGGASRWVTVFGFPPSQTAAVIEELLSCGQIVSHHTDTANSNWVHVEFETAVGAQRALTKDGAVFGPSGTLMLGVRRRVAPRHGGAGSTPQQSLSMSRATPQSGRNKTPFHNQSLYLQERSSYSVASAALYSGAPYAQSNSWWSRFAYYVFGW